jgi:hypothetical protein
VASCPPSWLKWYLTNFLPWLASDHDTPALCLPGTRDRRHEPPWLAKLCFYVSISHKRHPWIPPNLVEQSLWWGVRWKDKQWPCRNTSSHQWGQWLGKARTAKLCHPFPLARDKVEGVFWRKLLILPTSNAITKSLFL